MPSNLRIYDPVITIDGTEFKCLTRSVELVPGDTTTYCGHDWTASLEVEISYGVDGSFNLLDAMRDQKVVVVLQPAAGVVSLDNPSVTFSATIPPIPMKLGARGEKSSFPLELESDGEPVTSFGVV